MPQKMVCELALRKIGAGMFRSKFAISSHPHLKHGIFLALHALSLKRICPAVHFKEDWQLS